MVSNKIVNLANPTSDQDAATRNYVDTKTTDMATSSSVSTAITNALGSSGTQENRPTVQRGDTTNATHYLTFIDGSDIAPGDGSSKRGLLRCDGNLIYNPNTNILSAGTFSGAVSGGKISGAGGYFSENVGIGTETPSYRLHVVGGSIQQDGAYPTRVGKWILRDEANNGNVFNVYSDNGGGSYIKSGENVWRNPSDRRLKENIIYLTKCTDIIKQLKPCNYNFILDVSKNIQSGFIAQEIQEVLPHVVSSTKPTDSNIHLCPDEVLGIGIPILIPYMVGSIQEVDREQQADKARIAELEATVAAQQSLINDILERLKKVGA
jgi:hypothetical protein